MKTEIFLSGVLQDRITHTILGQNKEGVPNHKNAINLELIKDNKILFKDL